MTKSEKIKQTQKENKERRKKLKISIYQLKLQNLSELRKESLERVFLEAKWLYNWLLSDIDRLNLPVNKVKSVFIKARDKFENRDLTLLGSQIKQGIAFRLQNNLHLLKSLKDKGYKVGRLKFKKSVNSIPLPQPNVTYKLGKNSIKIQRLGKFRVLGLHQIPSKAEYANALLVRKPSGYYIYLTCYVLKEPKKIVINKPIGIDLGIKSKLTLSNGMRIDFEIPESKRLKREQKRLAKRKANSNNSQKTLKVIQKEYEKLSNKRKDAQNKIIAFLKCYDKVVFQDDKIKNWKRNFGRQIQYSGIGGITSSLKNRLETSIPVSPYALTTNECFNCGRRLNLKLSDRKVVCDCGWKCDRDINASYVILKKGLNINELPLDWREVTPVERETSARILGSNPYILVSYTSLKQEALPIYRQGGSQIPEMF